MKIKRKVLVIMGILCMALLIVPSTVYALNCFCYIETPCADRIHCISSSVPDYYCKQFCVPPCVPHAKDGHDFPNEAYGAGCCGYTISTVTYASDGTGTCNNNPCTYVSLAAFGTATKCYSSSTGSFVNCTSMQINPVLGNCH